MPPSPSRARAIWALALAMILASAASVALLWQRGPLAGTDLDAASPRWAVITVVALAFFVAERAVVVIRVRHHGIRASLGELPMAVALLLTSPAAFILGRALGSIPGLWPTERDVPGAWLKYIYNVAILTLGAVVTWLVHDALTSLLGRLGGTSAAPTGVLGALALLASLLIGYAGVNGMILLAIRLTEPQISWPQVLRSFGFSVAVTVALSVAGVFMAVVAHRDTWFLALCLAASVGLYLLLRIYGTLGSEHLRLQKLYDYSRELSGCSGMQDGAVATLRNGAQLLDARAGLLWVPWADGVRAWALRRDGRIGRVPIEVDAAQAVADLLEGGASALVTVASDERAGAAVLRAAGYRRVVISEFTGHRGSGWLAFDSPLTTRDGPQARALLENIAAQSAAAIGRTELVDELREENERRERDGLHDRLTGLPNREHFARRLDELVKRRAVGEQVAVLLIDLDRFKEVNDSLGHQYGDMLLCEVGRRLAESLDAEQFLARLGGDEFGVLLHAPDVANGAEKLAQRITRLLERPVEIADTPIAVGGSTGIALCPQHAEDPAMLLQQADIAMYAAKRDEVGFVVYEPQREQTWLRRIEVLGRMRASQFDEVLDVHFQPQVDLDTRQPVALEALARWTDATLGPVSPVEFIPVAEQSGMIRPLTMVVVEKSLAALRECHRAGHDLSLAVNLSGRALLDLEVVEFIREALLDAEVSPDRLTIEVTESVFVSDSQRLNEVLLAYEDIGVQLSIDDFGTGWSSLSYLRRLPARELKIDRSFVDGMVGDASKLAIVRSTVALAHELGLSAVAEGIEDMATMALLRRLGCDVGQGYFLGRPMSAPAVLEWLRTPSIPLLDELEAAVPRRVVDLREPLVARTPPD